MTEALSVLPQGIPASRPKKMSRKEDQVLQGLCQIVVHGVRRPLMPRGDAVGLAGHEVAIVGRNLSSAGSSRCITQLVAFRQGVHRESPSVRSERWLVASA
jgi:hypothetical protein